MGASGSICDGRLDEGEIQVSERIEQFWRPATADDVVRVMNGETVEARFRDGDWSWSHGTLCGWSVKEPRWYARLPDGMHGWAMQCQVYDPPSWFLDKPDPGEGWRLLGKFPHEDKLEHDEEWDANEKHWKWNPGISRTPAQVETTWYRRRIETNSPAILDSSTAENTSEAPHGSRSRNTIPGGWRLLGKDEERLASDAHWSQSCKEWLLIGDDRVAIANELPKWHAIRKTTNMTELSLIEGFGYVLPGGGRIRVTAKGFDVLQ